VNERIYIGIDPGLTGAVATIDSQGRVISLQDTPTIKVQRGGRARNEYSEPGMAQLLRGIVNSMLDRGHGYQALVAIENVHSMPKQGVASSFHFGVGYGIWRGIIAALGLSCQRVEPAVWKKAMGVAAVKNSAVAKALLLYPNADICYQYRGRTIYQDGRAEALLLARYALTRIDPPKPIKTTSRTSP